MFNTFLHFLVIYRKPIRYAAISMFLAALTEIKKVQGLALVADQVFSFSLSSLPEFKTNVLYKIISFFYYYVYKVEVIPKKPWLLVPVAIRFVGAIYFLSSQILVLQDMMTKILMAIFCATTIIDDLIVLITFVTNPTYFDGEMERIKYCLGLDKYWDENEEEEVNNN